VRSITYHITYNYDENEQVVLGRTKGELLASLTFVVGRLHKEKAYTQIDKATAMAISSVLTEALSEWEDEQQ
jgi:hypothetical protein